MGCCCVGSAVSQLSSQEGATVMPMALSVGCSLCDGPYRWFCSDKVVLVCGLCCDEIFLICEFCSSKIKMIGGFSSNKIIL